MHQQPTPLTFPCMPAPNMLGIRFAVMMMPSRVPDHVYGGTAFLASPTVPSPPQSRGFSLPRGEARPKGRYPGYPTKRGRKTSILRNWKLFLVKGSVLRPAGGIVSAPCQDRFTPCPLPPSARPLLLFILMMVLVLNRMMLFMLKLMLTMLILFYLYMTPTQVRVCLFVTKNHNILQKMIIFFLWVSHKK